MKGKKKVSIIAGCAAVVVAVAAMLGMGPGGGGGPGGDMGEEPVNYTMVDVAAPQYGDIAVTGEFIATVEPNQQVTVYPKAAGEVLEAFFNVGDTVEQGDTLLKLDSTALEFSIAQTQASINNASARARLTLEIAQEGLEDYEYNATEGLNATLLQAQAQVRSAENTVQQTNNDWNSARRSYNDGRDNGNVSDTELDALRDARVGAELRMEAAQLALEQARANLAAVEKAIAEGAKSASQNVRSAEIGTDLSDQRIGLQKLQNDLKDYTVTAPISGIIEQRNVDPYDMASSATPVFVISNKDAMTISFQVSENTLSYLQIGDVVTLEKNGETAYGTISELPTMVDAASGLYAVKANVQNAPFSLHSGSTVKVYVDTQKAESSLLIPIDAVYYDNGEPFVYVEQNRTAVKKMIETGISNENFIVALSGVDITDQIIVTWSSNLEDGAEILLVGDEIPTAAPAGDGDPEETEEGGEEPDAPSDGAEGDDE